MHDAKMFSDALCIEYYVEAEEVSILKSNTKPTLIKDRNAFLIMM